MKKDKKYEILLALAGEYNSYNATQWLKAPHPGLHDQSPAELIKKGDGFDDVLRVLMADIKKKQAKS